MASTCCFCSRGSGHGIPAEQRERRSESLQRLSSQTREWAGVRTGRPARWIRMRLRISFLAQSLNFSRSDCLLNRRLLYRGSSSMYSLRLENSLSVV